MENIRLTLFMQLIVVFLVYVYHQSVVTKSIRSCESPEWHIRHNKLIIGAPVSLMRMVKSKEECLNRCTSSPTCVGFEVTYLRGGAIECWPHTDPKDYVDANIYPQQHDTQTDSYQLLRCQDTTTTTAHLRCVEFKPTEEFRVVQQASGTVLLKCTDKSATQQIWTLKCVNGQWVSEQQLNCTSAEPQRAVSQKSSKTETSSTARVYGMLMTIGMAVAALLVVLGFVALLRRCLRSRHEDDDH